MIILLAFFLILFLVFSLFFCKKLIEKGKKPSLVILGQIASFAVIFLSSFCFPFVAQAANVAQGSEVSIGVGLKAIGAALAGGLASIGGGIAIAAAAPAAIGATSEDPKNFVKSLIFVALGESIALFGILFVFMLK